MDMEDIKKLIGKNLCELRKRKGLTQIELAQNFNYTDRAISKWENGDTLPDIEVLYNLCEFYGVTIDYLTHEDNEKYIKKDDSLEFINKMMIISLVSLVIWSLATVIFVYSLIKYKKAIWQTYVWSVPANALLVIGFNRLYFRNKFMYFLCWSVFIWGVLAATYLTAVEMNIWPIFLLGIPAQASLIVWLNIRKTFKKKTQDESK